MHIRSMTTPELMELIRDPLTPMKEFLAANSEFVHRLNPAPIDLLEV